MKPRALFGRSFGFQVEVCPTCPLTNNDTFGAVRFETGFAWCKGDVVPALSMSTGVLLFLVVIVARHVDDKSNQYGSRGQGYFWEVRVRT